MHDRSHADDAQPQAYGYDHAKQVAGEGIWSVALPDAPNIAPKDVVVMCVGPHPGDERYDPYAIDAGGSGDHRWIALLIVGEIEGEIDMVMATETAFLNNYKWTPARAAPLPIPDTMATLIGIVSGTRTRSEAPLPAAAARTIVDAMTAEAMTGHVQQTLPASRLFQWFTTVQIVTIAALAIAGLLFVTNAASYAHAVRIVSIGAVVVASCGILVDANYRRETLSILRLPDGYEEGRGKASKHLRLTCFITGCMGLVMFASSNALA
ncbi:hypothetical protein [Sphingomonas sp. 3-13AW]|uniref:hypothetical protein n=1 Tax=Sphingomonas sp. 3-13AW TaxID=3050450 RepID=UPI003BB4D4B2